MKKTSILLAVSLVIIMSLPAQSQVHSRFSTPSFFYRNYLYGLLGYSQGPSFKDFFESLNSFYAQRGSSDSLSDFKGNVDFAVGLRVRFSRHFASEFDFSTYSVKSSQRFIHDNGVRNEVFELNVAIMSATMLVMFDFSSEAYRQPVVPVIGAGLSIFPLRLDHDLYRFTETALAGNFSTGLDAQISRSWWATLRIDWTLGKTHMGIDHPVNIGPNVIRSFKMDLSTVQYQAGIMYGFF